MTTINDNEQPALGGVTRMDRKRVTCRVVLPLDVVALLSLVLGVAGNGGAR
ncbi:hypothetical protein GCM10009754_57070 [Amycolatopsis minnesotensis]|uniref:Uncharacterized protein n=1 Tax=Amycolatopsis minnesotensis TaxID=337894 RepID=A0ABN2RTI8_9PSEU